MIGGTLAIGCAAGFGGDRTDAAGPVVDTLIARGGPGVLVFEVLAERTLALAQLERRANPKLPTVRIDVETRLKMPD